MGLGPPSPVYRGEGHRGGISCLSVLEPLTLCRGPSCLVKFVYLSASSVLEPGTRQLVAFSSCLARVAEVSSAVLPTLVPTRTAVLASAGASLVWLWSPSPRLALWALWPPVGFAGGVPSRGIRRISWPCFARPLDRGLKEPTFCIVAGFLCHRSFPCLLSQPPAFFVGGGGVTQLDIPPQF